MALIAIHSVASGHPFYGTVFWQCWKINTIKEKIHSEIACGNILVMDAFLDL
jgi:hypothetical protein